MPKDGHCLKEHEFGKLDSFMTTTTATLAAILEQAKKTNGRISALEKWRTILMAVAVTLLITETEGFVRVVTSLAKILGKVSYFICEQRFYG